MGPVTPVVVKSRLFHLGGLSLGRLVEVRPPLVALVALRLLQRPVDGPPGRNAKGVYQRNRLKTRRINPLTGRKNLVQPVFTNRKDR